MNPFIDSFYKIGTPVALLFVGIAVLISAPKVDRLNSTLGAIKTDVQEINRLARNPAPVVFDISKATASGIVTGLQQRAQDVRENGLASETVKTATDTAKEAAAAAGSLLKAFTDPPPDSQK